MGSVLYTSPGLEVPITRLYRPVATVLDIAYLFTSLDAKPRAIGAKHMLPRGREAINSLEDLS